MTKPKPKFKVGQIIYNRRQELYNKITFKSFRQVHPEKKKSWRYVTVNRDGYGDWDPENVLRSLTKREVGQ